MVDGKKKRIEFFNKKARFDYEIIDSFETGIVLSGLEIKAIRDGRVNISNTYAKIIGGEVFLLGAIFNVAEGDAQRTRKLLLHKHEIKKLIGKLEQGNLTLLPLKLYFKRQKVKIELGIGKGMKKYDKREKIKKRDIERELGVRTKDFVRK